MPKYFESVIFANYKDSLGFQNEWRYRQMLYGKTARHKNVRKSGSTYDGWARYCTFNVTQGPFLYRFFLFVYQWIMHEWHLPIFRLLKKDRTKFCIQNEGKSRSIRNLVEPFRIHTRASTPHYKVLSLQPYDGMLILTGSDVCATDRIVRFLVY